MADSRQTRLIEYLLTLSRKRELEWKEAVFPDAFETSFPSYSLLIGTEEGRNGTDYYIFIVGANGEIVDRFTDVDISQSSEGFDAFSKMREIHDSARRIAKGADKALDEILGELEKKDV